MLQLPFDYVYYIVFSLRLKLLTGYNHSDIRLIDFSLLSPSRIQFFWTWHFSMFIFLANMWLLLLSSSLCVAIIFCFMNGNDCRWTFFFEWKNVETNEAEVGPIYVFISFFNKRTIYCGGRNLAGRGRKCRKSVASIKPTTTRINSINWNKRNCRCWASASTSIAASNVLFHVSYIF